jgi:hypothetical protein
MRASCLQQSIDALVGGHPTSRICKSLINKDLFGIAALFGDLTFHAFEPVNATWHAAR